MNIMLMKRSVFTVMYNILINPASRSGKGFLLWEKSVVPYLIAHHIDYTPYFSPAPGVVESLMKRLLDLNSSPKKITIIILDCI